MTPKYLWNTDFFKWVENIDDHSFDTIITDPPYKSFRNKIGEKAIHDKTFNLKKFCEECVRILKPNGIFISFCSIHLLKDYFLLFDNKLKFRCIQIWDKRPTRTWISYSLPLRHLEYIVYFGDGILDFRKGEKRKAYKRSSFGGVLKDTKENSKSYSQGQYEQILTFSINRNKKNKQRNKSFEIENQSNLLKYVDVQRINNHTITKQTSHYHPTQKPPEFSEYFKKVIKYTGKVLDPCCGSGSLICSFNNAIGIDIKKWRIAKIEKTQIYYKKLDLF